MEPLQAVLSIRPNSSSSPSSTEDPPLLSQSAYAALAALMGVFSAAGILLNLLVVVVTVRHRQQRQPLSYALVNLAVCDLGCAALGGVPTTVANAMGYFSMGRLGCVLEGFAVAFFGIASLCTVAVIAVERYMVVCRPMGAVKFQTRHAVGGVALSWLWSFLWNTPPLFGWGSFQLEGVRTSCAPDWYSRDSGNMSYIAVFFLLCFALPFSVILLSYCQLLRTLRQVSRLQVSMGGSTNRVELQVARMVAIMVLAFLVAWLPYAALALTVLLEPSLYISPQIATVPVFLAKSSTMFNPIIYIFMNRQFRDCTVLTLLCGWNPWASAQDSIAGDTIVYTQSNTRKQSNKDLEGKGLC